MNDGWQASACEWRAAAREERLPETPLVEIFLSHMIALFCFLERSPASVCFSSAAEIG